jgi:hypothetical protein
MDVEISAVHKYLSLAVGEAFGVEGAVPSNIHNNCVSFDCSGLRLSFYHQCGPHGFYEKPRYAWFLDFGYATNMLSFSIVRSNTLLHLEDHGQVIQAIKNLIDEVNKTLNSYVDRLGASLDEIEKRLKR